MPCIGATVDDLDIAMFRQLYLPKAVPEDVLREDGRDVELQLQSLGFFDKRYGCPTYAGILFFGKQVERFLPGAYIRLSIRLLSTAVLCRLVLYEKKRLWTILIGLPVSC